MGASCRSRTYRTAFLTLLSALGGCREPPSGDRQVEDAAPPPSAPVASAAPPAPPSATPVPPPPERLVILAGGDVNLARGAGKKIKDDPTYDPFRELGAWFSAADLRFVNLESQLSDRGELQSADNPLIFSGPPGGADALARARVDVVSLANNHAWDYGKPAFLDTIAHLERAKVRYAGASVQAGQQYEPVTIEVKGYKIALFAVTNIWNQGEFDRHAGKNHVAWAWLNRLEAPLARARKDADVVLLSYHGGSEYVDVPMTWTRDFVREAMERGIDAVIGHHPHVPHGVAWFGTRPAFYSLGNLVFGMHSDHVWTGISFLAKLTYERGRDVEVEACPYVIEGHVPRPFYGANKGSLERQFTRKLKNLSLGLGGTVVAEPDASGCMRLTPARRETRVATTP